MLYIRTGLPGNGKTLNTIKEVDLKAKTEGRTVYFHNVAGLDPSKLQAEWFEFEDPLKWHELPHNSIIVVDEAQGSEATPMFGTRDPRKAVPEHITAFETMRHRGHEVHLITQDPRFLDVHARRLCNKHIHYWRIFGSQKVSRYETERVVNDVEKLSSFSQSSRTIISLDKKYFGVYTSTQAQHHFRFRPSKKAVMAVAVIGLALFSAVYVWNRIAPGEDAASVETSADSAVSLGKQVFSSAQSLLPGAASQGKAEAVSAVQYVAQRVPRVENLPASAPVYDSLTEPQSFPRLYCMSSTDPAIYAKSFTRMPSGRVNGQQTVCQCYTQQGTRVKTDFRFCMDTVEYGFFDSTLPERGTKQDQRELLPDSRSASFAPPGGAEGAPTAIRVSGISPQPEPRTLR